MIGRPLDASDDEVYSPCKRRRVASQSMVSGASPASPSPSPSPSPSSTSPSAGFLPDTPSTSTATTPPDLDSTDTSNTNKPPTPIPSTTPLSASSSLSSLPSDAGYLSDLEISRLRFPTLALPLTLAVLEDCLPESLMSIELPAAQRPTRRGRTSTPKVRAYGLPAARFAHLPPERGLHLVAYPHLFVSYTHAPGVPLLRPPSPPPSPSPSPPPPPKTKRRGRPLKTKTKTKTKPAPAPAPRFHFPRIPIVGCAVDESAMRTQLARLLQLRHRAGGDIPDRMARVFSIAVRARDVAVFAIRLEDRYSLEEVFTAPITPDGLVALAGFLREEVSGTAVLRERVACIDAWGRAVDRAESVAEKDPSASASAPASETASETSATLSPREHTPLPRLLTPASISPPQPTKCHHAVLPDRLDNQHKREVPASA